MCSKPALDERGKLGLGVAGRLARDTDTGFIGVGGGVGGERGWVRAEGEDEFTAPAETGGADWGGLVGGEGGGGGVVE